jgi:hypothetical protein
LVPEPIEKCAVWAASPSRTRFPSRQRSLRTVTKLIQRVRFSTSSYPNSASHAALSSPVAVVDSTMNVLIASL